MILTPVLKNFSCFSLSLQQFPTTMEEDAIFPILKKSNNALVSNYISIFLFSSFSKMFEFVTGENEEKTDCRQSRLFNIS